MEQVAAKKPNRSFNLLTQSRTGLDRMNSRPSLDRTQLKSKLHALMASVLLVSGPNVAKSSNPELVHAKTHSLSVTWK